MMENSEWETMWKEAVVSLIYGTILASPGGPNENNKNPIRIDGASAKIRTGQFENTYQKLYSVSKFVLHDIQEQNVPFSEPSASTPTLNTSSTARKYAKENPCHNTVYHVLLFIISRNKSEFGCSWARTRDNLSLR
jgi:hypothetical protein